MVNRDTSLPPLVTNNVLTCASQPQSESSSLPGSLYSQSLTQTRASRVSGVIELRLSLRIRPLKLNADSEDTVLNGIARKSRAMVDRTGYLSLFVFHQLKILNFSSSLTCSSSIYASSSDLSMIC